MVTVAEGIPHGLDKLDEVGMLSAKFRSHRVGECERARRGGGGDLAAAAAAAAAYGAGSKSHGLAVAFVVRAVIVMDRK